MSWVLIALLPTFFWSLSNVVDQFLARSYFDHKIAPFLILSGLCTLPIMLVLGFIVPDVLAISPQDKLILFGVGAIQVTAIIPYFKAIQAEDSTLATPIFQCIPFLVYLLGWLFLGETMEPLALVGGVIILAGGVALNWQPATGRINLKVIGLMGIASMLFASQAVIIRQMVQDVPWYTCAFWGFAFWSSSAVVGLCVLKQARTLIWRDLQASKGRVLGLCSVQEWLDCAAQLTYALALSLAPTVAHVAFLGGLAPLYVLGMVAIAGRMHPAIYAQMTADRHLLRKIICCVVILGGLGVFLSAITQY